MMFALTLHTELPEKDIETVVKVVAEGGTHWHIISRLKKRIKNITHLHYLLAGEIIGQIVATDKAQKIQKLPLWSEN